MISHKHKWIFIHVIKTAGSSIEKCLSGVKKHKHEPASKVRKAVGEKTWNSYFKFSFVRNPFDKIVSQYHFNRHKWGHKNSTFKEYVDAWSKGDRISTFPQLNLHYIDEELDFIGRFENLQEDFNTVCDRIGIHRGIWRWRRRLPHANKTKHKHYTEYYDDETRQIVAERYAKDIEHFGYRFQERG